MNRPQVNVGLGAVAGLALVGLGVLLWINRGKVLAAVNPIDQKNLANRSFNALAEAVGITAPGESVGANVAGGVVTFKNWLDQLRGISAYERGAEILIVDSTAAQSCRLALKEYDGDVSKLKTDRCRKLLGSSQLNSDLAAGANGLTNLR